MFKDLAKLFSSPTRIKILKYFVFQPELRVGSSNVASTLGMPVRNTETELKILARAGILNTRRIGKTTYYFLARSDEFLFSLKTFLEQTTLPSDTRIVETLRAIPGLSILVATGVLADEPRASVDMLVVTKRPKDVRIAQSMKKLENLLALPVRYAVLELEDYRSRLESYDRLLRDVFEFNHRVIYGRK